MRYHNITKDDMLNGDGLRVVLWVSGCDHCCKECHNPITWDPNGGLVFDEEAKEELFEELKKDYVSGITFSGGDPLYAGHGLCRCVSRWRICKRRGRPAASLEGKCQSESDRCKSDKKERRSRLTLCLKPFTNKKRMEIQKQCKKSELNILQIK